MWLRHCDESVWSFATITQFAWQALSWGGGHPNPWNAGGKVNPEILEDSVGCSVRLPLVAHLEMVAPVVNEAATEARSTRTSLCCCHPCPLAKQEC